MMQICMIAFDYCQSLDIRRRYYYTTAISKDDGADGCDRMTARSNPRNSHLNARVSNKRPANTRPQGKRIWEFRHVPPRTKWSR